MTDYAELRAALEAAQWLGENCFVALNSAEIRALLAERDAYFFALQEIVHPEGTRASATQIARAALASAEASAKLENKYPSEDAEYENGRMYHPGYHWSQEDRLVRVHKRYSRLLLRALRQGKQS